MVEEKEVYKHYKTGIVYVVTAIAKAGDKEDDTLYVIYEKVDGTQKYVRTMDDFTKDMGGGKQRFEKI